MGTQCDAIRIYTNPGFPLFLGVVAFQTISSSPSLTLYYYSTLTLPAARSFPRGKLYVYMLTIYIPITKTDPT